jgi:hypothetical protein
MTKIGIVGAGIAGLQLALFLQKEGVTTTLYSDKTPEQLRQSRLPNLPVRFDHTRKREAELGINYWDETGYNMHYLQLYLGGEQPLSFTAQLSQPGSYVDMRLYLPRLLQEYQSRGGEVVIKAFQDQDLADYAAEHELMVVSAGRGSLVELFPRLPEYSPYTQPPRLLTGGYFTGIRQPEPFGSIAFVISPGHGEIFQATLYTQQGLQTSLLFEAIPGGAFEVLNRLRYQDNSAQFNATALQLLQEHAPTIYERITPTEFGVARSEDLLQGAITPVVRQGYARLGNGKFAIALGDVHILNDPLLAQGANTASYSAWMLGQAILEASTFDERFCQEAEARVWEYARYVTEWSNASLQPPPPHLIDFLVAASQNQSLANQFADGFNQPVQQWSLLSDPVKTQQLVQSSNRKVNVNMLV